MAVFRSIVLFACLLTLTNCSDDSGKLAGPGQDLSRLRKAFTALVSPPPTGPETCLTSLDPCQTSSARPGGAAPQKRSATAASQPVVELAAVQATTGTSSPNVYTIIADAEDFSPLSELVNVLNGDGLRVLPVVGLSALNHLVDITRNGVDLAIVPANAVAFNREVEKSSGKQVRYVGRLYDEKLHVLARREITELRQLDGRKVNIGPSGGGAELAAQALFATLGIQPVVTNHHVETAREQLQTGDIDAAIFLTARPAYEVTGFTPKTLVHLLPVPHHVLEGAAYEPAWLEASQYPALIESGKSIPTVRIANVLAVSDAPQPSPRQKRLTRLVREFYERAERLHRPDQPTAWQEFDPAREVPGWTRFRPAEDWLKRKST